MTLHFEKSRFDLASNSSCMAIKFYRSKTHLLHWSLYQRLKFDHENNITRRHKCKYASRFSAHFVEFVAYFVAQNFVPIDLGARHGELASERLERGVRHRLIVLIDG